MESRGSRRWITDILDSIMESSSTGRYLEGCCLRFKGAILVLVWSALLHSSAGIVRYVALYSKSLWFILGTQIPTVFITLLYPLAGLLTEVKINRFKFMIVATIIMLISHIITPFTTLFIEKGHNGISLPILTIGLVLHQTGLGMFEANVIQFGVDQLQFANNKEVSKFVHWYYWSMYAVQPDLILVPFFHVKGLSRHMSSVQAVVGLVLTSIALSVVLYCRCCLMISKGYLFIEPTSRDNPVTLIWKVLKYSRRHSQPVKRSAFTYGDPPPSRIDMAKDIYGGPFTVEEVEDVKMFWKVSSLLITLFGLSLAICVLKNLGFIVGYNDYNRDFDFFFLLEGLLLNQSIFHFTIIVSISLYLCIFKPLCASGCFSLLCYNISMLKKIGIGMIIICATQVLSLVSSIELYKIYDEDECIPNISHVYELDWTDAIRDTTLTWLTIGQVLGGLGYTLVFLTVLEFILAQAPRTMQGLLIGLWYAYQAIGITVYCITELTQEMIHCHYWPYIVLTVLSFISLSFYTLVSYKFKYRQREEPTSVNYPYIIEEYTMRHLGRRNVTERKRLAPTVNDYNIVDN